MNWNGIPGLGWYEVRFRLVGDPTWTGGGTQAAPTTFKNIIGLIAGGNYEIQVRGFCSLGNPGPWGASEYFTTLISCPAPTGLFTSNVTGTTAKLNWAVQPTAAFYETRYKKATDPWSAAIMGTTTPNSKNLAGLIPNTQYEWQVRSVCLPLPYSRSSWEP
ncbi:MAG: fibronectin type III domain-containing protein [Bacteroidota bacterium]|nr:MAG: fibronectin type III domain-containing protein [Bacteroidota bacterium]